MILFNVSTLDNVMIADMLNDAVNLILVCSMLQIRYSGGGVSAKAHR